MVVDRGKIKAKAMALIVLIIKQISDSREQVRAGGVIVKVEPKMTHAMKISDKHNQTDHGELVKCQRGNKSICRIWSGSKPERCVEMIVRI